MAALGGGIDIESDLLDHVEYRLCSIPEKQEFI